MRKLLLLTALVLAGCCCEAKEPYWEHVCVRDHTESMMVMTQLWQPNNTFVMMPHTQYYTVCDEREWQCKVPKKWTGEPVCPPMESKQKLQDRAP